MGNDWFHEYFINELKAIGRKPTSNMQHEVVDSLPSSGNEQTIYFVKNDSSSSNNHYDEYVWISSSSTFEKIGSSQIDGSAANPDWNQNDATQPDYVKNRPFYTGDQAETVLVEERVVTFEDSGAGLYTATFESTFVPTVGETYKVSWDGTVYECACVGLNDLPVIGNISIPGFDSDSGEPFFIALENNGSIAIATADTASSHTISISGIVTPVVKIDEKYLPDTVATKSEVDDVRSIAETGKIDPSNHNTPSTLFSTSGEFIGWYGAMPILKYNQTVGNFFIDANETNPIKIDKIPFGSFMCIAFLNFNLSGFYGQWYIMHLTVNSTGNTYFVTGPMISPKGNVFYVKSNEVGGNTAEGIFFELLMPEYMMINSSTSGSTKKFRITVDDSGTISAKEVT